MASRKVRSDENVNKCDDKVNKADDKCGVCSKKVTSIDDGVQCEICSAWFHCKCQHVSSKMYDVLGQFKHEIHWFCNGCNEKAGSILSFIQIYKIKLEC